MWLKIAIVIIFFLLLISLFSGLFFLLKDQGNSKRTLHSLTLRVSLTAILLGLVSYGVISGELKSQAPWDRATAQQTP
ncbi:hypothetical protein SIN8267_03130 [Sinobacterium norvegicum]|uniref:DUF2909 domain-containing protein n=1 Tax=Sinobacterium norvegicum TaxID=1641715 RepID=A0ABM9AID4_9GAMM|nr:twin transmembrane helix small protein [Sinobacterium norvegicum]CAH0992991.1 hypothetical protein SIN8267_03130 [Sinobacterium norvegicum]